jgi:hypothetical protein
MLSLGFATMLSAACASGGGGAAATSTTAAPTTAAAGAAAGATQNAPWPIKTREHVDLWLHGFAMLQPDTTLVPYFRRGYRDRMVVLKNRANVVTLLDQRADSLRTRFARNRELTSAQFLALQFASWDEMRQFVDYFIRANGNPNRASSREVAMAIAQLAAYFPSAADRAWLSSFVEALEDERVKYYHSFWLQAQRERQPALAAVDTLWQQRYRPKLQRFLNNTQQPNGDLILSLPLEGEGRTIRGSKVQNLIAVTFPEQPADATDAIYVFAHETAAAVGEMAVNDNTTPNERRMGVAQRYESAAAVIGGLLLLQKAAPELADGYARFYLHAANLPSTGAAPQAALGTAFPLPQALRDAISRQLDVVLGGI